MTKCVNHRKIRMKRKRKNKILFNNKKVIKYSKKVLDKWFCFGHNEDLLHRQECLLGRKGGRVVNGSRL